MNENIEQSPEHELVEAYKELELARSNYDRGAIRERIRQIEKKMVHNPIDLLVNTDIHNKVVEIHDTQSSSDANWNVQNMKDVIIKNNNTVYETVRISDCKNVCIREAYANTSCYIENTHDSVIYTVAQQVRVKSCSRITLYAYTKTGIYIEDTRDIVVHKYIREHLPEWKNDMSVHDFTQTNVI